MRQEDKKNYVFYQEAEKKGNVRSGGMKNKKRQSINEIIAIGGADVMIEKQDINERNS